MNDDKTKYGDAGKESSNEGIKKDVQASDKASTPNENDSSKLSEEIITQNGDVCQEKKAKIRVATGKKGKKIKSIELSQRSLSAKFYAEQINGWEDANNANDEDGKKKAIQNLEEAIRKLNPDIFQCEMICHDKDKNADGIWAVAIEKPHYHLIVRRIDGKTFNVNGFLHKIGVFYRPDLDDSILKNHGIETVGDFTNMTAYLLHQTEQAIADAKATYEIDKIVSNMSVDEIQSILEGYVRVSETTRAITPAEWEEYDRTAYDIGYQLEDYDAFYKELPFSARSSAKLRTVEKNYNLGVNDKLQTKPRPAVDRVCIYIHGEGNIGKTYALSKALFEHGNVLCVSEGGKTGNFDNLTINTNAIILDDCNDGNLFDMCDDYVCRAYRRNSNNPVWKGKYYGVTNNDSFPEWIANCMGYKFKKTLTYSEIESIKETEGFLNGEFRPDKFFEERYIAKANAIATRFCVCHIENIDGYNRVIIDSLPERGNVKHKISEILKIQSAMNDVMATYKPDANYINPIQLRSIANSMDFKLPESCDSEDDILKFVHDEFEQRRALDEEYEPVKALMEFQMKEREKRAQQKETERRRKKEEKVRQMNDELNAKAIAERQRQEAEMLKKYEPEYEEWLNLITDENDLQAGSAGYESFKNTYNLKFYYNNVRDLFLETGEALLPIKKE